jgi:hypothetical protein
MGNAPLVGIAIKAGYPPVIKTTDECAWIRF